MKIIHSKHSAEDHAELSKAWFDPQTFVFLPEKNGTVKEWIEKAIESFPPEKFRTEHFCLLTSGSTGQPKLVVASRTKAEMLTRVIHERQENEEADETILALPLTYCFSFVNQWLWAQTFNRRFIYTSGFSEPSFLREALLKANRAMICLVGQHIPLFQRYFGKDFSCAGILRVHFAGGPFPQKDMDVVHALFPNAKVFNNYGCTEAMPRLTIREEKESAVAQNVGRPLPGIEMRTDENDGILFRSPYSAVGFYDKDGFFMVKEDTWLPTGDIGQEDESGCWHILGRSDGVFKRFGEKISISKLLETVHAHWKEEAVFYREKRTGLEEGHVLVICPKPTEEQYRAILNAFRKNHPRTHWPIRLESVESVPLLANGKIDQSELASMKKDIHWYQRGF